MEKEASPKKLQRVQQFEEALQRFKGRYKETLEEGDRFLSGLYMDEIVYTILLQRGGKITELTLRDAIRETMAYMQEGVVSGREREFEEDVEVAVRKRFPEKFGIERIGDRRKLLDMGN